MKVRPYAQNHLRQRDLLRIRRSAHRHRITSLLPRYENYLRLEQGLRDTTADQYLKDVREVTRRIEGSLNRTITVQEWTRLRLQSWLNFLTKHRKNKPTTVLRRCCGIRSFCRWLVLREYVDRDIGQFLLTPKLPEPLPNFLTLDEVETLINAPYTHTHLPGIVKLRDNLIWWLLWEGALRAFEVTGLSLGSIRWDTPRPGFVTLRVWGKGRRERLVPLKASVPILRAYMDRRSELRPAPGEQALILSLDQGQSCTRNMVTQLVRRYARRVGIKAHAHLMRHTTATWMMAFGADIRAVQLHLGHKHISTTARYAHVPTDRMLEAGLLKHPANRRPAPPVGEELVPAVYYHPANHEEVPEGNGEPVRVPAVWRQPQLTAAAPSLAL